MIRKLRSRLTYANVMSTIACFCVLATGSAYVANTVFSTDIVDGEVKAPDIAANAVDSARVRDNTLNTFDVHSFIGDDVIDGTLTSDDIQNFSLGNGDFLTGSVDGRVVTDNSLTAADIGSQSVGADEVVNDSLLQSDIRSGAVTSDEVLDGSLTGVDIDESTLNLAPVSTTTFAGISGPIVLVPASGFVKVMSKTLAPGSWAVVATVNSTAPDVHIGNDLIAVDLVCELRNGSSFIGGATGGGVVPNTGEAKRSLSMNGGAQIAAGGGEVSVWCSTTDRDDVTYGQMMLTRIGGFS